MSQNDQSPPDVTVETAPPVSAEADVDAAGEHVGVEHIGVGHIAVEHDAEGQTPAAWVACGGVILASLVAGAALIVGSVALGVVSVVVLLGCLAAGGLIGRAQQTPAGSVDASSRSGT